jgi:hypothetical protein
MTCFHVYVWVRFSLLQQAISVGTVFIASAVGRENVREDMAM